MSMCLIFVPVTQGAGKNYVFFLYYKGQRPSCTSSVKHAFNFTWGLGSKKKNELLIKITIQTMYYSLL